MKMQITKDVAKSIGDDSFELLNFTQLPDTASVQEQVDALRADQMWQEDHHNEISRRIAYLISDHLSVPGHLHIKWDLIKGKG